MGEDTTQINLSALVCNGVKKDEGFFFFFCVFFFLVAHTLDGESRWQRSCSSTLMNLIHQGWFFFFRCWKSPRRFLSVFAEKKRVTSRRAFGESPVPKDTIENILAHLSQNSHAIYDRSDRKHNGAYSRPVRVCLFFSPVFFFFPLVLASRRNARKRAKDDARAKARRRSTHRLSY